jgi:hypothetical protein
MPGKVDTAFTLRLPRITSNDVCRGDVHSRVGQTRCLRVSLRAALSPLSKIPKHENNSVECVVIRTASRRRLIANETNLGPKWRAACRWAACMNTQVL